MKNREISIVIPAKNEEKNIASVLRRVKKYGHEIIVADGRSTDKTRKIARRLEAKVIIDDGKGKGAGMRLAIKKATGDIIVFIDADGSHNPKDIPKLIAPILTGKSDHVVGSRMRGGSDELHGSVENFFRWIGSGIITFLINLRFNTNITESQNGFRAIRTELAKELKLQENITTIEQEITIKSLKAKHRLTEIPAHEYRRKSGHSCINLRKVWFRYIYSLFKYLLF